MSYRVAYRAMQQLAQYAQAKEQIKASFLVSPRKPVAETTPLKVSLVLESLNEEIPLGPGQTLLLPITRRAFDEDAEIRSNRKTGSHEFQFIASTALQADGVYPDSYLQSACEQVFNFVRQVNILIHLKTIEKRCQGVTFFFPATESTKEVASAKLPQETDALVERPSTDAPYKTYEYRFGALPAGQALHPINVPVFIKALYE